MRSFNYVDTDEVRIIVLLYCWIIDFTMNMVRILFSIAGILCYAGKPTHDNGFTFFIFAFSNFYFAFSNIHFTILNFYFTCLHFQNFYFTFYILQAFILHF